MQSRNYAIVIEGGEPGSNFSAYVPDLPGCIATGHSLDELRKNLAGAIRLHLFGMHRDGDAIPEGSSRVEYVQVPDDPAAWGEGVQLFEDPPSTSRRR